MRIRWLRRGGIALGLSLTLAGGLVAWTCRDPWPVRRVFPLARGWALAGFAAAGRSLKFRNLRGDIDERDVATGQQRPRAALHSVPRAFSRDGRSFVAVAWGGWMVAWGVVASGAIRARFSAPGRLISPTFAADGRSLRAFLTDQPGGGTDLITWDLATGAEARQSLAWSSGVGDPVGGSPAGTMLEFADRADRLDVRDVATGTARGPFGGPGSRPDDNVPPIFTPDGRSLVIAGRDDRVEAWDVGTARLARTLDLPFGGIRPPKLALSPDGRTLAVGGDPPRGAGDRPGPGRRSTRSPPNGTGRSIQT